MTYLCFILVVDCGTPPGQPMVWCFTTVPHWSCVTYLCFFWWWTVAHPLSQPVVWCFTAAPHSSFVTYWCLCFVSAVDCGRPPEPTNGVVFYSSTTLDSVATYSCRCGFQLEGSSIRRCLSNGLWSGNNTQCNG